MQVIPFGNVIESRMDLSKKYDLIKCAGQVWLLTEKCRKHYDPISYIEYLQGKVEKPAKKGGKVKEMPKVSDMFKDMV